MRLTVGAVLLKSGPLFILMALARALLFAQSDSISFEADSGAAYLTPMEYAFMMHEETKFMVRLPFVGAGAEVELLPHFTFMAQARLGSPNFQALSVYDSELRWYYSGKKGGVRNMSGNYIAGGMQLSYIRGGDLRMFAYTRWGMQRRMLGNGLIDMGFLAGYQPYESFGFGELQPAFRLSTTASLGLGLVFGSRKELDWQRLCPVTKCYDVERFIVKVNVGNALNYSYFPERGNFTLSFHPKVALEHKVLRSSFSVNASASLQAVGDNTDADNALFSNFWLSMDLRLSGRWYYNLKHRMVRGKGGNGLSGNYIAAGVMHEHFGIRVPQSIKIPPQPYVSTGVQRTLGRRFYLDVSVSLMETRWSYYDLIWVFFPRSYTLLGDVQVGFRF